MKTQLLLAVLVTTVGVSAPMAVAGPLGQVNRDIGEKQERSRSAPDRSASPSPADICYGDADRYGDPFRNAGYVHSPRRGGVQKIAPNYTPAPVSVDAIASYQNVADSDGSLNADLRIAHGLAAVGFSSSSFFEDDRLEKGDPTEQSRLTRWELSVQGRALRIGDTTNLWIGVGIGQLHGTGFDNVTGVSVTGELRHKLDASLPVGLGAIASARGMMYSDDIKAGEFRAGVTASIAFLGYRYLEFNVGPPLHGPELGVSLSF